jgi:hypothetical protein
MDEQLLLHVELYRWAQRDWEREAREGFSLVRALGRRTTDSLIGFLETLSPSQRSVLGKALLKKFHPMAAQALGEKYTSDELDVLTLLERAMPAPAADLGGRCDRKVLRKVLKSELAFLGKAKPFGGPSDWEYLTPVGAWELCTYVDTGGRLKDVSYNHSLRNGSGLELHRISLLSWLGVSGVTKWNVGSEEAMLESAKALARACRLFVEAVPEIVKGVEL